MSEIKDFVKRNFIVLIALAAALFSCTLVPSANYIDYVDTDVIGILFSLMLISAGFKQNNVLSKGMGFLLDKARIYGTKKAMVVLSLLTFFLSMLVTNDAALIALVPVTVTFFLEYPKLMIYAVVVQTAAANIGSMATPFGNPQNLLIFTAYDLTPRQFFEAVVPTAAVGLALVMLLSLLMPDKPLVTQDTSNIHIVNYRYCALYAVLLVLTLLAVFGIIDVLVAFVSACVVVVIIEPNLFGEVDYGLLLTFIFFFIFVGNVKNITRVNVFVSELVRNREFFAAAASSQVISNVPAAVMLQTFTDNWKALLLGTDVGGLGTPIASMASLISFRIYSAQENIKPLRFLGVFLGINIILLAVLYCFTNIFII